MAAMSRNARNQHLASEVYQQAGQACFYTICGAPQAAPFRERRYADIAMRCLLEQQAKSHCSLLVYCVMPDHIHVVVAPERDGCSSLTYVDRFKG
jgi:REP element-mobilizing transposase RayT